MSKPNTQSRPGAPEKAAAAPRASTRGKTKAIVGEAAQRPSGEAEFKKPRSVIAIITVPERAEVLAATLADLKRVGLTPDIVQVQDEPPGKAHQRRNVWRALHQALDFANVSRRDAPGVLLLEDDIDFADTFAEWVEYVERQQEAVTLHARGIERHWPADAVATHERMRVGKLVDMRDVGSWWGSQAIWLPFALVAELVSDPRMPVFEYNTGPFDTTLALILKEQHDRMLAVVPGVVLHRGHANVVSPQKPRLLTDSFSRTVAVPKERL